MLDSSRVVLALRARRQGEGAAALGRRSPRRRRAAGAFLAVLLAGLLAVAALGWLFALLR